VQVGLKHGEGAPKFAEPGFGGIRRKNKKIKEEGVELVDRERLGLGHRASTTSRRWGTASIAIADWEEDRQRE